MFIVFLVLAFMASVLPFARQNVYYMVTDDYLLNYIANGSYGREGSDHLISIRMPVGTLLKALYGWIDDSNWYLLLLLFMTIVAFALLHYGVWKRTRSLVLLILSLIFNYFIVAHYLSFTVVAFLTVCSAAVPVSMALRQRRFVVFRFLLGGCLVLAGYFLRDDAAVPALGILLPLLMLDLIRYLRGVAPCENDGRSGAGHAEEIPGLPAESMSGAPYAPDSDGEYYMGSFEVDKIRRTAREIGEVTSGGMSPYGREIGEVTPGGMSPYGREIGEITPGGMSPYGREIGEVVEFDAGSGTWRQRRGFRRVQRNLGADIARIAIPLALFVFALVYTNNWEHRAYQEGGWASFTSFNDARMKVVDRHTADYEKHREEFGKIGFSRLDYNLLNSWRFAERGGAFSDENLLAVSEIYGGDTSLDEGIRYASSVLTPGILPFLFIPLILLFAVVLRGSRVKGLAAAAVILLFAGAIAALTLYRMRFVMRVVIPLDIIACYAILLLPEVDEIRRKAARAKAKANAKTNAKADVQASAKPYAKADIQANAKSYAKADVQANAKSYARANAKTNARANTKGSVTAKAGADSAAGRAGGRNAGGSGSELQGSSVLQSFLVSLRHAVVDIAAVLLIFVIFGRFNDYYEEINPMPRMNCEVPPLAELTKEIASHPDTLYVMDSSVLSRQFYFGTPVNLVQKTDRFRNIARSGSWDSYSPRYYAQVSRYLDNPDNLLTGLVDSDRVVWVSGSGAEELRAFYREQKGGKVKAEEQPFPGSDVSVWRLSVKGK